MVEPENQSLPGNGARKIQRQETQKTIKQLIHKYNSLLERYTTIKEENAQLREEIEYFNKKLIEREREVEHLERQVTSLFSILEQLQSEENRLPAFQIRSVIKETCSQQHKELATYLECDQEENLPNQALLSLNVWLVTRNRFVDKIVGHYTRKRDRVLVIQDYELLKRLISIGMLPDIIITGAYDFALDDPTHTTFFKFLDQVFAHSKAPLYPREFFIITLSSTVPAQPSITTRHHNHVVRHEFISKFRGLQVTISEVRFFLEMRRCRGDFMEAESVMAIRSMSDVARIMMDIQQQKKTGMLAVLSSEEPTNVRWAFQLFFLRGKLVKTEHTLESSVLFFDEVEEKPIEKIFTLSTIDAKHQLNKPDQLFFFPLYQHTILHELHQKEPSPPSLYAD